MKCAQCGFLLLSARKNCPRCGAAITESLTPSLGSRDARSQQPSPLSEQEYPPSSSTSDIHAGTELPQQGWGAHASSNLWNAQTTVSVQQKMSSPSQQLVHNPYSNTLEQQPSSESKVGASGNSWISPLSQEPFPRPFRSARQNANGRSTQLGFTVAGLCVITSSLILTFVYFMAMSLPPVNGQSGQAGATPTLTPLTSTPGQSTVSATPTLPGQAYIDNVQLASQVDPIKAQAVRVTTNFKVNQRMYVTFVVHAGGQSGTVCLLWYLNTKQFSYYPLLVPIGNYLLPAYSYTNVPPIPGSGYVELYWGHSPTCNDPNKKLAQRVNFTVSA
jgi:hypothetical protein